ATTVPASAAAKAEAAPARKANPIWGWICLGIVVLLAIWLVVALIRAFTGSGSGGYGGGGGGYGGGGGGGGFFPALMGGLFGAAAGMWMYDRFFSGHASAAGPTYYPPGSTGVGPTGTEAAPSDVGGEYHGEGGEYGGGAPE